MLGFGLPSREPSLPSLTIVEEDLPLFPPAPPPVLQAPQSSRNRRACLTKLVSEGVRRGTSSKVATKPAQPPFPGYWGCGGCLACSNAVFADRFLVVGTDSWYLIPDALDCTSGPALYLATCLLCPTRLQYGGVTNNLAKTIIWHREEAERRDGRPDNDLSEHLALEHGGWYSEGVQWQLVKQVSPLPSLLQVEEREEKDLLVKMLNELCLWWPQVDFCMIESTPVRA